MLKSYHEMGLDLGKLLTFQAVAEELSFRRASERLGQAQPAVSRQIKALEAALDCRLFERDTSGTRLTVAGEELRQGLPEVFESLTRVLVRSRLAGLGQRGRLRVGCPVAAINTYLPPVFGRLRQDQPDVGIEMVEKSSAALLDELSSDRIDCCFVISGDETAPVGVKSHTLFRERMGVVLPVNHELARGDTVAPAELAALPYLSFARVANPQFYDRLLTYFESKGVKLSQGEPISSRLQAIGRAGAGMGFTTLSRSLAYLCGEATVFRTIDGDDVPEIFHRLLWRADTVNPVLKRFLERVTSERFTAWTDNT